jgi:nucleolin
MAKETVNPKGKPVKKPVESDDESSDDGAQVVKKQKVNDVKAKQVPATKKKAVESSDESEPEVVVQPTGKGKVAQKVEAKAKVAAKKTKDSDESSEDEKPAPKKGAPVGKAQPAKVTKPVSSDESDAEPVAPKKKVEAPKAGAKAPVKKPVESSSEEDVKPAAKKGVPAKKVAAKMDVESDSSEEAPKTKATTTKPVAKKAQESDESEEEEKVAPKKAAPASGVKGSYECYVGNLPFNASENDLKEFFASCGEVDSVNLLKGPDGRSKGIAFIRFTEESAQTAAVEFNGEDYNGRAVKVEKSIPKEQRPPREGDTRAAGGFTKNTERDPSSTTIFVGNLGYRTNEDTVAQFFGDCGEVKAVRVAYDQDGRSRGFAHVEFAETTSIDTAMAKAGQEIEGRAIRVDFSGNKKSDGGSRGGFGGGGRGGFGGGGRGGFGGGGRGGYGGGRGGNDYASQNKGSIGSFQGQRTKF